MEHPWTLQMKLYILMNLLEKAATNGWPRTSVGFACWRLASSLEEFASEMQSFPQQKKGLCLCQVSDGERWSGNILQAPVELSFMHLCLSFLEGSAGSSCSLSISLWLLIVWKFDKNLKQRTSRSPLLKKKACQQIDETLHIQAKQPEPKWGHPRCRRRVVPILPEPRKSRHPWICRLNNWKKEG